MKKLFFSALAIVAFSLTSFANEVENKIVVEPVKEVATTELSNTTADDECYDVIIKWTSSDTYFDEEFQVTGVEFTHHEISFTICL